MPYKYFTPQQLTATEVNEYLMNQSVMVFASAAERDTSLTAPTEGMTVYLRDTDRLMTYDGSSWVIQWMRTRPAFYAYATALATVTSPTAIVFQTVVVNNGSHYNSSNGRFTAPVTGLYWLESRVLSQLDTNGMDLRWYKNGAILNEYAGFTMVQSGAGGAHRQNHIQGVISLVAGDYVTVSPYTGSTVYLYGSATFGHSSFSGFWIA